MRWPGVSKLSWEVPGARTTRVYRTAPVVALAAGADRAGEAGEGHLRVQLAVGHRHRHFPGRDAVGVLAADLAGEILPTSS